MIAGLARPRMATPGTVWWQPIYLTTCWRCSCSLGPRLSGGTPCSTRSCSCTLLPHSQALGASALLAPTPPTPTSQTIARRGQARSPQGRRHSPQAPRHGSQGRRHTLQLRQHRPRTGPPSRSRQLLAQRRSPQARPVQPRPAQPRPVQHRLSRAGLRNRPDQLSGGAP